MPRKAYLTIDDSPCEHTPALADFLAGRNIPALLFVRGAFMEEYPDAIPYAIQKGLVIGNHSYAHIPAGDMTVGQWREDFEKTENLINAAYEKAGVERTGKYYRFPYIDRGDGIRVERIFASGEEGGFDENEETAAFQRYLKEHGFTQPFANMPQEYPSQAADCLFTYTSSDWMLTPRHKGHWECKTLDDLKARVDDDPSLQDDGPHVILMHDQDGIHEEVCALIDYFIQKNFTFLDFASNT